MLLTRENGSLKVFADTYSLEFAADRPFVYVENTSGKRLADLFALSAVHPLNGRDDTTAAGAWRVEEGLDEVVISVEASSAVWEAKTYRFRCSPRRFSYEIEVRGQGQLAEAEYFGGYYSGQVRWGSGFFYSGQRFQQGFNPEPACEEIYTFSPEASATINLTGVPLPGKGDWFFTPPPFCYAFDVSHQAPDCGCPAGSPVEKPDSHHASADPLLPAARGAWMGVGVEARPGENRYTEFRYHGGRGTFFFSLPYEGHTRVDGRYLLPALAFDFGPDPYTLLAAHVQHLRSAGLVHTPERTARPLWWNEPIFCGWGAQCHLAKVQGGRAPDFATQANYEGFLATLAANEVHPGTVVLDDKWQSAYGENEVDSAKWHDLPGFVQSCHARGQHVLLWLKAWDPEGVPVDECIVNAAGLPLAVDPTHPAFERRLRASVRRMLSADGYDADGFKIDFSARIPSGPGMKMHGDVWGLELMRLYLWIIQDEARQVKPDALIITHTPHPYLADLVDAVRLNDINTNADVCRQMTHRARVAAIACPDALIDMDNWPLPNKAAWRSYLGLTPALGIPALYYTSHIDSTGEPLTAEDYALLRESWAAYRASIAAHHRYPAEEKISAMGGAFLPVANPLAKRLTLPQDLTVSAKPLKSGDEEPVEDRG